MSKAGIAAAIAKPRARRTGLEAKSLMAAKGRSAATIADFKGALNGFVEWASEVTY
jgi:hypothetical protein